MGKWEVEQMTPGTFLLTEGDIIHAKAFIEETAQQICLMHNEVIELLKRYKAKDDVQRDLLHIGRSILSEQAQDLLKRMGVDCG